MNKSYNEFSKEYKTREKRWFIRKIIIGSVLVTGAIILSIFTPKDKS